MTITSIFGGIISFQMTLQASCLTLELLKNFEYRGVWNIRTTSRPLTILIFSTTCTICYDSSELSGNINVPEPIKENTLDNVV